MSAKHAHPPVVALSKPDSQPASEMQASHTKPNDTKPPLDGPGVVTAEFIKVLREQNPDINVNLALTQIHNNPSPSEIITVARELSEINTNTEERRLVNMKKRFDLMVEYRTNDPDEIEKRANNKVRRWLKHTIPLGSFASIVASVGVLLANASALPVALVLACGGVVGLIASIPLASGESVSSGDLERIFSALAGSVGRVFAEMKNNRDSAKHDGKSAATSQSETAQASKRSQNRRRP